MDIVIIANFCMDFSESDNGRFSYLAELLAAENNVEIITSDFYHIAKSYRKTIPDLPYKVTLIHEPSYRKNVSLKRFYSHYSWGKSVQRYLNSRSKPDVVYCAVPSLTASHKAAIYCAKNQVKFVIDIQDLWPEAFKMIINVPFVYYPFTRIANSIYSKADKICAVSHTYVQRALAMNKKCCDGTTVYLGTLLDRFDLYSCKDPLICKPNGDIWITYCGTLGSSYDLTCVIDAISIIGEKGYNPTFIVMGDGPKKEQFEHYAERKKIRSIFTGRLSYEIMCGMLSQSDINVNPITHNAAQSIINKHADYCASGKPVVSTQENTEYQNLIDAYHMGYNCKNNDANDMADKLLLLINDPCLREIMGRNARRCAEELFDRHLTYKNLCDAIIND